MVLPKAASLHARGPVVLPKAASLHMQGLVVLPKAAFLLLCKNNSQRESVRPRMEGINGLQIFNEILEHEQRSDSRMSMLTKRKRVPKGTRKT
jgi:hypothetical protein